MASYGDTDLISLAESPIDTSTPVLLSPSSFGSTGKSMALNSCRNGSQCDSFSDLVGAMKAKKSYCPIPTPSPQPSLSSTSNGLRFGSRASHSEILSPTAKPFVAESVNDFLEKQGMETAVTDLIHNPYEREMDFDRRLAALDKMIRDKDASECYPRTPSPPVVPVLESPLTLGPVYPPKPAESVQSHISVYDPVSAPVVRVTKEIWESMGKEVDTLKKQKRHMENQLVSIQRQHNAHLDEPHDVGMQLGKLRYENEANRDQKASMGRALAQKDVEIKKSQLDIDILRKKIVDLEAEINQCGQIRGEAELLRTTLKDKNATHTRELETSATAIAELEETIERLTLDRDAAVRAQAHAGDHVTRAQNLVDTLAKREKVILDHRQQIMDEKLRSTYLEDEVEHLREKLDQENLDDLKEKLREKTSQCDRYRTQLKGTEQQLKLSQTRLKISMDGGEALKGGAHLVAPNTKSTLPRVVMSCSECYALNLPCDNGARCRSCTEGNRTCARWRCSMKHKLGECHMTPCVLPHDSQGWLIMPDPRPEW